MNRSIGLVSGPSGNAGCTTDFNDHQTSPLALSVFVSLFAGEIETQKPMIQSNAWWEIFWVTRLLLP